MVTEGHPEDLVLRGADGRIVIYPYGSEEQQRFERVVDILSAADRRALQQLEQEEGTAERCLTPSDRRRIQAQRAKAVVRYNLSQTARSWA